MKKFTWINLKKSIAKEGLYYFFFTIMCVVMMIGMLFNFTVMTSNQGKMPVYLDFDYSDEDHFSFQNFSEVKYPYYSDIIYWYGGICSIGDILMVFAVIALLSVSIYRLINEIRKLIKKLRNENHRKKKNGRKK